MYLINTHYVWKQKGSGLTEGVLLHQEQLWSRKDEAVPLKINQSGFKRLTDYRGPGLVTSQIELI